MINLGLEAVATPAASTLNIVANSVTGKLTVTDSSGNSTAIAGTSTKDYRLISVQTLIATNAALVPPTGATAAYFECYGGGAGSAGLAAATASQIAIGQAGGGGAYSAFWAAGAAFVAGNFNCTVGAGGTAGGSGATNGIVGGDTSVVDSGSTTRCLAKGGSPGLTANTLASGTTTVSGPTGGAGGLASAGTGDIKVDGGTGAPGQRFSGLLGFSGAGGNGAAFGNGGLSGFNVSGTAPSAGSISSGAGGALDGAATARTGGAGIIGLIRISWFAG